MRPAQPSNEQDRLAALRDLEILDTGPAPDLDDLVELAAAICGTPTSQITLVDTDRVCTKAAVNVIDPEAPRDDSFCAHAILGRGLFVVNDARVDPRFVDNPYVTVDPGVRFYAGAPLVTSDGFALGTLCVIDQVPRRLDIHQMQALRALAGQATAQLELRRYAADAAREIARQHQMEQRFEQVMALLGKAFRERLGELRGYVEILRDTADLPPALTAEIGTVIRAQAPELLVLFDALLQLPAGPSGQAGLERRDVDLNLLVDWAVREIRPIADAKNILIRFEFGSAATVHAQPRRLSQALGHLLFTAITFTPRGGRVTVQVKNPDSPTVELHDVGAQGEPTRLYEHVLNGAIRRLSADAPPGPDAGLTAVKAIFDLHHATVALLDSATEGTDMHVIFPPA